MRAGRPISLTDEMLQDICKYLSEGQSKAGACGRVGISTQTLWRWERDIPAVREAVDAALAKNEADLWDAMARFVESADERIAYNAVKYKLAVQHGKSEKQQIELSDGRPNALDDSGRRPDPSRLTDEEWREYQRLEAKLYGEEPDYLDAEYEEVKPKQLESRELD